MATSIGGVKIEGTKRTAMVCFITGRGAVMSFPAHLNDYNVPALREVRAILRGDDIVASEAYQKGMGRFAQERRYYVPIGALKFVSPINRETTYANTNISESTESHMQLYQSVDGYMIEWDIPELEVTEHIGLEFKGRTLTDYDGVFSLPVQAIQLLRACDFIVPREFV